MSKHKENSTNKKICKSSLVLGIVGLVFSAVLPVVTYGCAIPGLVIGIHKNKKNYNSSAGVALSIIALTFAAINSILGVMMTLRMYMSNCKDKKSIKLNKK